MVAGLLPTASEARAVESPTMPLKMLASHMSMACLRQGMLGAGLPEQAPQAGAAMTALLRKAPDSNAPIAQEYFKLLATLLRACSSYQVHSLLPGH